MSTSDDRCNVRPFNLCDSDPLDCVSVPERAAEKLLNQTTASVTGMGADDAGDGYILQTLGVL